MPDFVDEILDAFFCVSSVPDFLRGAENKIGNFTQLSLDTTKYRTRGT